MFPKSTIPVLLGALLCVSGCERKPTVAPEKPGPGAEQADYAAPPTVTDVRVGAAGVTLNGRAPAGAKVRLGTPAGEAVFAQADAQGRWGLNLPPAGQARIFGVSEQLQGRQVQAQGYLIITPGGKAALLRAGAGAVRLDALRSPALGAVDFDRDGAAVVSGAAAPRSLVFLRLDGRQTAEARTDEAGRYAIVLPQPLTRGAHAVEAVGDGFANATQVEITPPAPLAEGPLRSQFTRGGLRVDWLTPGGGVQSTVLLD